MMSLNLNGVCVGFWNVLLLNLCSSTLTDNAFVKSLYDNGIVVWGGDVRDQDAWSGKKTLGYPFSP